MSNDTRIAVDVTKAVFELAISDRAGHVARRVRLPQAQFRSLQSSGEEGWHGPVPWIARSRGEL
jgi:hypothetical protein